LIDHSFSVCAGWRHSHTCGGGPLNIVCFGTVSGLHPGSLAWSGGMVSVGNRGRGYFWMMLGWYLATSSSSRTLSRNNDALVQCAPVRRSLVWLRVLFLSVVGMTDWWGILPNNHAPHHSNNKGSYLVDPASSHMLVSKIKPCMSKYKLCYTVKLRMAH
jgi:hypothetical protein